MKRIRSWKEKKVSLRVNKKMRLNLLSLDLAVDQAGRDVLKQRRVLIEVLDQEGAQSSQSILTGRYRGIIPRIS